MSPRLDGIYARLDLAITASSDRPAVVHVLSEARDEIATLSAERDSWQRIAVTYSRFEDVPLSVSPSTASTNEQE